ncbi:MAG: TIGR01777 family protein [Desulfobulbaceae bacterium]|uniref:TIGR01777 family protein n=1 Tax=Candidatus Desulfatifera sulfidica TaxID=2841691 RepID=A0A8J6NAA4_9BACT|nr:TIGR01777 family protein [Candidatus Desulfatifera sulfidica]
MGNVKLIAMSGANGFVGSHMCNKFKKNGWEILALGRNEFALPPEELTKLLQGADVIVNLAGAPVISRWTEEYKKVIYESRVTLTRKLVSACKLLEKTPHLFLSTSAIGCYSATGTHTEDDNIYVDDFLGHLTRDWEQEAFRAKEFGCRTAIFRFGVVLGQGGGALAKMLLPFKLGLGGTIGNGMQPFSWIHIKDLIRAVETAINDSTYEGVYNMTAPHPTTNFGLTKTLGRALSRPTIFPIPEFVLRLLYGEGAQVLTSGQTVLPQRLLDSGFQFDFPSIEEAVADCLKS